MTSLSEEEENYVRMSLLLTGVSPRAVRCKFDKEFAPAVLPATIQKEYHKLSGLKGKRVINQAQWNTLHPRNGVPDSKNFDVTLMICLLRNLTTLTPPCLGFDRLPPPGETTEGADLARIKYYRNYLAHLDDTNIDNPYFTSAWKDVADAVLRLGSQSMVQECQELKIKTLDQSNKEIMLEIKTSQEEMKHFKEEMKELFEGLQDDMKKEVGTQKASHRDLKKSHDSLKTDLAEKSKEIEDLTKSYVSLKTDHDEKTREVETLVKSNAILQKDQDQKREEIDKLKAAQEDVVPWNIRGQINRKLETWKKDDKMFMETRAATRVLECVKTKSCVTVTGSSGMGKTFTVRHVALQMAVDGYDILPVTNPDDIEKLYNPNKKALFVIDNFCGTYTLNQNVFDKWKSLSADTITDIFEDGMIKIIVSCRSQVYQDELFKTLPLFTSCECNLRSKEFCLSPTERLSLAELYLKTDASEISQYVNLHDCFPLLCKLYKENPNFNVTIFFKNPFTVYEAEVSKLWTEKAYGKYCALALCVMFNNHLKEEWLTEDIDKDMRTVIENTCESCKLERGTSRLVIRDELESLSNTFIRKHFAYDLKDDNKEDSSDSFSENENIGDDQNQTHFYCTIHDKLFDYLVKYFGKVMKQCLIKNADSKFVTERFVLEREHSEDEFTIIVPDTYQQMYLQRMIDDWSKGHVSHVFSNINMKKLNFRDIFLKYLNNLKPLFQNKLAEMCDVSYKNIEKKSLNEYGSTTPLIHCCLVGDINMLRWFCDHGSDINHCNSEGKSPLYMTCTKGNVGVVTKLLDNMADVNQCDMFNESPLYVACRGGYTEVVTQLLDNKADVNQCTVLRKSPLYIACGGGYTEVVTKLLHNKADVNQCTVAGESPLYTACERGYTEVVSKLLDKKADVNQSIVEESLLFIAGEGGILTKIPEDIPDVNRRSVGESPLYIACKKGYTEIVTKLMDSKADVNQYTAWRESPLYVACRGGHTEVVTKVLDNKADVNQCTDWGDSPLFVACERGYTDLVTKCLDNKANVNQCTKEGESPLYIACKRGYTEVVTKLLDNKADVNQCTVEGESPLYTSCEGGYTEVVTKLLDNKADVNQCTVWGESPLYVACRGGYTEIVTKVLNNKADVNQCTDAGVLPLYIACEGGYTEVVTTLLDNKADVNQRTVWRESPLYVACKRGHNEVVSKLLDNKADVNQCTDEGVSHLFVACRVWSELLISNLPCINLYSYGIWELEVSSKNKEKYIETAKLLMNAGADCTLCSKSGESPLDLFQHQDIIDMILSWK